MPNEANEKRGIRTISDVCGGPSLPIRLEAHRRCPSDDAMDAMMVENLGYPVRMFPSTREDLKVTTSIDLALVETLLEEFKV